MFRMDKINELSETDMIIYKFILQNLDKVQFMRVIDLAEATHVSNASITRFIRKMGYDSFAEFRVKMKEEVKQNEQKELNNLTNSIYNFLDNIDNHDFQQKVDYIVELILEGRTLVFLGTGSSGINADYGARILSNVGVPAFSIKDPYYPFDSLMGIQSDLIFVVLSVTGEMPVVNELVTKLRRKEQNFVLSITGSASSTLAKLSNMNLTYNFEKEVIGDHYVMTSSVPVVYLIEIIARQTYKLKKERKL
ncbi:MurR/RpiR family transcriptional regulator [Desemzia sp. FAM 23991]|uniref:MurR/RpiR family transcriptional regulator n=1 Tax=unclassified Desemzia TaxID=2685243 RepID=UPI003888667C